jgi:acyl dehydratase
MTDDGDDSDKTERDRRLVSGWQGRYYEDFTVGDIYKHPYGRTVTETDNVWFTNVTMNCNPMHFNEAYASNTEFGERLVDGTFVIALAVGMSVVDVSANATANLGYDEIRHHAPVYHGDTLFAESAGPRRHRDDGAAGVQPGRRESAVAETDADGAQACTRSAVGGDAHGVARGDRDPARGPRGRVTRPTTRV